MASFRMSRVRVLPVVILMLLLAPAATARHDYLDLTVETSSKYAGKESVGPMPFYLQGQKHPKEVESLGEMKTDKRTRAAGRPDEHACSIAFQSAIIQLQRRATALGANAIVDIRSVTGGVVFESDSVFRCAVGNIVANVALTGRAVKLAK